MYNITDPDNDSNPELSSHHLEIILSALEKAKKDSASSPYYIPRIWQDNNTGMSEVCPVEYYKQILETLLSRKPLPLSLPGTSADEWTRSSLVYNLFVRLTTAFDHNRDGSVSAKPLPCGFRETGTFLKSIALLPYLERLGINTIYLLPVTLPGQTNKKGNLGSPYAVKNPRQIDPLLAEPVLGLSAETEFTAFMEAAHITGLRVVLEFVFRTTSVDSDWVEEHPDWYYWLRANPEGFLPESYAPPVFDQETLHAIYEKVDKHDFSSLPAPSESFRQQFTETPERISISEKGIRGATADGTTCIVASAFSDWPPDDTQPPWTDVAYLKLHRHESFNYIAYNTIRMYDTRLDRPEYVNRELWNSIIGIIPYFQEHYAINGAMIDMGHALPSALKAAIVEKARENNPDFAFWDENFDPSPSIREEGFNAVFGSLPFVIQDPIYIKGLLNYLNKTGVVVPFFGTGENHNTPRVCHNLDGKTSGRNRSRFIFGLATVLPAIPFIHSGMEICEPKPVNLGLNFTPEDREKWPAEKLPLFSACNYDWSECNNLEPLTGFINTMLSLRSRYAEIIQNGNPGSLTLPFVSSPELLAIMRSGQDKSLLFIGNSNPENNVAGHMEFHQKSFTLTDMVSGTVYPVTGHRLQLETEPGQCLLFEVPA